MPLVSQDFALSAWSKQVPKIHLALQYLLRNYSRIENVIAVRMGKSGTRTQTCDYVDSSTLLHYKSDTEPSFHYYETVDIALDIKAITHDDNSRIIQSLQRPGLNLNFDDMTDMTEELHPQTNDRPTTTNNDAPAAPPTGEPIAVAPPPEPQQQKQPDMFDMGGRLPTIHEDDAEDEEDILITEDFCQELINDETIDDDPDYEDTLLCVYPLESTPDNTVIFTCNVAPCHEEGSHVGTPYVTQTSDHASCVGVLHATQIDDQRYEDAYAIINRETTIKTMPSTKTRMDNTLNFASPKT